MGRLHFGYLITVCSNAEEKSPTTFPGVGARLHWPFDDPATFVGTEAETLQKFREVRGQIGERIQSWLKASVDRRALHTLGTST